MPARLIIRLSRSSRTVTTLGPASSSPETIERLIQSGPEVAPVHKAVQPYKTASILNRLSVPARDCPEGVDGFAPEAGLVIS